MRPFLEVRRLQEKEQKWYSGMLGVTFNAEEGRITIFRSTLLYLRIMQQKELPPRLFVGRLRQRRQMVAE